MGRSMGGGGGHSGGGRSMGGGSRGGSRSFSGSGRSMISGGGSHRTMGSSGGGYRSSNYGSGGYYRNNNHVHYHNNYYGGRPYYGRTSSGCGCSGIFGFIIVAIVVFALIGAMGGGSKEKLNRTKYNGPVDSSHGYYIDNSEGYEKFIDRKNETSLISGFKNFYSRTGVFPFLYIIERTPSKSEYAGYDTYQDMLYEKLFDSEGNFLILYIASEDDFYYAAGYDTGEIIDETSLKLISNKVNSYWYTGDLAKAFGNGLDDASKNIMAKSNGRVIMIVAVVAFAVVLIVFILFTWWKKKKEQENREQENLEKILSKPLESFGNNMDELTKKYDDPQ